LPNEVTQDRRKSALALGLVFAAGFALAGCEAKRQEGPKVEAWKSKAVEEAKANPGRLKDMRAKCEKTSDEGRVIVEKAKNWKPVVNGNPGDKPLKDIAAEYVSKGVYEVCWGASKKSDGRWKVWYDYIDVKGQYQTAEWEYEPEKDEMHTFNDNSLTFWTGAR
jgi:hypothetical protein